MNHTTKTLLQISLTILLASNFYGYINGTV